MRKYQKNLLQNCSLIYLLEREEKVFSDLWMKFLELLLLFLSFRDWLFCTSKLSHVYRISLPHFCAGAKSMECLRRTCAWADNTGFFSYTCGHAMDRVGLVVCFCRMFGHASGKPTWWGPQLTCEKTYTRVDHEYPYPYHILGFFLGQNSWADSFFDYLANNLLFFCLSLCHLFLDWVLNVFKYDLQPGTYIGLDLVWSLFVQECLQICPGSSSLLSVFLSVGALWSFYLSRIYSLVIFTSHVQQCIKLHRKRIKVI